MTTLIDRWKAETPLFWKKVRNFTAMASSAGLAMRAANYNLGLNLDPTFMSILGYVIAAAAGIAVMSQFTTFTPPPSQEVAQMTHDSAVLSKETAALSNETAKLADNTAQLNRESANTTNE